VHFNDKLFWLHDRLPIEVMSLMTEEDYFPSGCTALFDAIGESIEHIEMIHKHARPEDIPESTIFVIMTDIFENSRVKYRRSCIKGMISRKQEENAWEFLLLGANIDAAEEAYSIGISRERAANFRADAKGQRMSFRTMDKAISNLRSSDEVVSMLKEELDEDFESRKN